MYDSNYSSGNDSFLTWITFGCVMNLIFYVRQLFSVNSKYFFFQVAALHALNCFIFYTYSPPRHQPNTLYEHLNIMFSFMFHFSDQIPDMNSDRW